MRPEQLHPQSIYTPKLARIVQSRPLTATERFLRLQFMDGSPLGHQVGQFVEVSVFGVGEAPLTITSPPHQRDYFDLCVRRMGNVTGALHKLEDGALVGIRGPLGRGFPWEVLQGRNLLIVAGGIGLIPLRPVIEQALLERDKFKNITIIYGVKHPDERLFVEDLADWEARDDVDFHLTVDRPVEGWSGHVGVVTTLFPELDIDPTDTVALIVGPPVMYKFVLLGLSHKGLPDQQLFMSLERRMKCGVGKCGHCQINGVLTCQQGPTFSYAELKDLREAIG
jgi:NAD(P)H-flavin reductase